MELLTYIRTKKGIIYDTNKLLSYNNHGDIFGMHYYITKDNVIRCEYVDKFDVRRNRKIDTIIKTAQNIMELIENNDLIKLSNGSCIVLNNITFNDCRIIEYSDIYNVKHVINCDDIIELDTHPYYFKFQVKN